MLLFRNLGVVNAHLSDVDLEVEAELLWLAKPPCRIGAEAQLVLAADRCSEREAPLRIQLLARERVSLGVLNLGSQTLEKWEGE